MINEEYDELDLSTLLFGKPDLNDNELNLEELLKENNDAKEEDFVSLEVTAGDNCPICKHKIRKEYEDYMEYTLCEYRYVCDRCGLTSGYAYGNYETYIEDFGWGYSYNSKPTKEEQEKEREQQQLVLKMFRKIYLDNESLSEAEEAELDALEKEQHPEEEREIEEPGVSVVKF